MTMTDDGTFRFLTLENLPRQSRCHKSHSGHFFYMLITRGSVDIIIDCKEYAFGCNDLMLIAPAMTFCFRRVSADFKAYGLYMAPGFSTRCSWWAMPTSSFSPRNMSRP